MDLGCLFFSISVSILPTHVEYFSNAYKINCRYVEPLLDSNNIPNAEKVVPDLENYFTSRLIYFTIS